MSRISLSQDVRINSIDSLRTPEEISLLAPLSADEQEAICKYRKEVEDIINKKSGLLGVSGISNDCRNIAAAAAEGNYRAELALKILTNGIKKHIGAYVAEMNGIDALVFTAGIGENQSNIRELACEGMEFFGIKIDKDKNNNFTRGIPFDISTDDAKVRTWIIPTDEEYMIAIDTQRLATK